MKHNFASIKNRPLIILAHGILIGALLVLGIRFFTPHPETHYHANFAIYINDQRETFTGPGFYEEVVACADHGTQPAQRAHMHNQVNDLAHIHADLVTWGHFFNNIGYSVSKNHLQTPEKVYAASNQKPLVFTLNGQRVSDISNRLIGDEDKLLVSYGTTSGERLDEQYAAIASTAAAANQTADPGSCGGAAKTGWRERLKQLF